MNHKILLSCPEIIKDFLMYSETIKNKSKNTINEYYTDLRTFYRYILLIRGMVPENTEFKKIDISGVDQKLANSITLQDLYSFLVYCKNELQNSANTRARKCSTLKTYFKYLSMHEKVIDSNPAELLESPKTETSLPKFLDFEDSIKLLKSVEGNYKERNYCILVLFLNCGLRLSELCSIDLGDIGSDNSLRVIGKGNKERVVYLNAACVEAINEYLKVRPVDGIPAEYKDALFISRNKRRLSNKMVQYIVYKFLEKAGLGNKGLSTHKLRHTAATLMYQRGHVDIRTLKEILGHENLNTTQIYTHVSNEFLREAFNANPLAEIKKDKT